ncbi:M3 family oligoendopeptidase [Bacillus sp. NPDC077411]|uniref:M3 family oligoendopeptidase n=1 Tax=Bacillus sp. NPDC077411 TaxID=3363947 RepID=UPI0037CAA63D
MLHKTDFYSKDLETLQNRFHTLLNDNPCSLSELEIWLEKKTELLDIIDEHLMHDYIKYQCDTNCSDTKEKLEFNQQNVKPLLKQNESLLNQKLSDCLIKLDTRNFDLLKQKSQNSQDLFNEENIGLEIEEDKLITRYFDLTGNLMVKWEGIEIPLNDIYSYLQDPNKNIREKALTLISNKMLSVEDELQLIMDNLLQIRHKKAINTELTNYRDYMFKKYERLDYTPEDCTNLAESIRKYVVPLQEKLQKHQKEVLNLEVFQPCDIRATPSEQNNLGLIKDSEDLIEKSINILEKIDPTFSDLVRTMLKQGCIDLESRKGKAPGGFCEYLPNSKLSFIFMNLSYTQNDIVVFLHEMGHCLHNEMMKDIKIKEYRNIPMESSELASMTLELLTMEHWGEFYSNEIDLKNAKREQLRSIVEYLPFTIIIDQFQHWLYENPIHTSKERNQVFKELMTKYDSNFVDWTGYEKWLEIQWLSVLHIFEVPFYYVEYAIAQLGALQMYKQYKINPKQTLSNFKKALSLGSSKSLKEVYQAAGIKFDFSEETIKDLMEFVEQEILLLDN